MFSVGHNILSKWDGHVLECVLPSKLCLSSRCSHVVCHREGSWFLIHCFKTYECMEAVFTCSVFVWVQWLIQWPHIPDVIEEKGLCVHQGTRSCIWERKQLSTQDRDWWLSPGGLKDTGVTAPDWRCWAVIWAAGVGCLLVYGAEGAAAPP